MHQKKMYVVVRQDLDDTYRMVQGAHALSQFILEHPGPFFEWHNGTIVFLGVKHEGQLYKLANELSSQNKDFASFYEEDLGGECTGIACYDEGDAFKKYNVI